MYISTNHHAPLGPVLTIDEAERLASLMSALATASRVRILSMLRAGPSNVNDLCSTLDLEQSAVSHQLRILRDLSIVTGSRSGRSIIYSLHDTHIASLLDEAFGHLDHLPDRIRQPEGTH